MKNVNQEGLNELSHKERKDIDGGNIWGMAAHGAAAIVEGIELSNKYELEKGNN